MQWGGQFSFAVCYADAMLDIEEYCGPEWAEWYLMTPQQRWEESDKLWGV